MEKYIQYYKTKIPYIIALLPFSIYAHFLMQNYIDCSLVANNIFVLHFLFLAWEYFYPERESFSYKSFFLSLKCLFVYPFALLSLIASLKVLQHLGYNYISMNISSLLFLIGFSFILFLALEHSRHNSDLA